MVHSLAPEVHKDLDEIWLSLARESGSETVADDQIDAITERFFLLANYPRTGRARDDDLGPGTRSFPVGDYVIVYDIDGEDVQILCVAHARRDLIALFEGRFGA
jgi:toxin ParE1/3/4